MLPGLYTGRKNYPPSGVPIPVYISKAPYDKSPWSQITYFFIGLHARDISIRMQHLVDLVSYKTGVSYENHDSIISYLDIPYATKND